VAKGEVRTSKKTGKKYYYNPVAAKERRTRILEHARAGGYTPQRRVGSGLTVKKVSKNTGMTYYYTPWSNLSPDQKAKRLDQSRKYARETRELARAYRQEHGG
jgi:hypothetical protein